MRLLERPRIGEGDALRAADLSAALEDALIETGSRCRVGIGALPQAETANDHLIRLQTHVDAQHANGALDRQARADQQREAGGDLDGDEQRAGVLLRRTIGGALLAARSSPPTPACGASPRSARSRRSRWSPSRRRPRAGTSPDRCWSAVTPPGAGPSEVVIRCTGAMAAIVAHARPRPKPWRRRR